VVAVVVAVVVVWWGGGGLGDTAVLGVLNLWP